MTNRYPPSLRVQYIQISKDTSPRVPRLSLSHLNLCMSNAYIRKFCSTHSKVCIHSKSNTNWMHWTWGNPASTHINFGGSLSMCTFLQKKITYPTTGRCRCCSLLLHVKELLTCKKMEGPFLIWPHHRSPLDWTRAQHCYSRLFIAPQSCSITKNKKRGSSSSYETKIDN